VGSKQRALVFLVWAGQRTLVGGTQKHEAHYSNSNAKIEAEIEHSHYDRFCLFFLAVHKPMRICLNKVTQKMLLSSNGFRFLPRSQSCSKSR
jgi:hypothetical protein